MILTHTFDTHNGNLSIGMPSKESESVVDVSLNDFQEESPKGIYRTYVLGVLMVVYGIQTLDRQIISILIEPIRKTFQLSDVQVGLLSGLAFTIPYGILLIPIGVLIDRFNRRNLLAGMITVWSIMTVMTAFTTSLFGLLIARGLIAAAEAGNSTCALSILADLFKRGRRATAISIYYAGPAVATTISFPLVAMVAVKYGWRSAFLITGIPGIAIGILILFTTREPDREGSADPAEKRRAPPSLRATGRFVLTQRSLIHMMCGITISTMVATGHMAWVVPLLTRIHGMRLVSATLVVSLSFGAMLSAGQLAGGFITDYVTRTRINMLGWMVSIVCALMGIAMLVSVFASAIWLTVVAMCFWNLLFGFQYGPVVGTMQSLVQPQMRGVVNSGKTLAVNLIGAGLGPLVVGAVSEAAQSRAGVHSIAWGLAVLSLLMFIAAAHHAASARWIAADFERARG